MKHLSLAVLFSLAHLPAFAHSQALEDYTLSAIEDESEHNADEEAEMIRQARLAEMAYNESYAASSDIFRAGLMMKPIAGNCRFVSGISTPPPAKRVVLTFDDGPDSFGTPYVLQVLQKYNIPATFFV